MATILEFRQGQRFAGRHTDQTARRANVSPAEIVFFPGVRYERWDEAAKPKPKKRTRRRDRLEIDGTA